MTLHADFGPIGSKLVVDGKMYGGIALGIGLALTEDFVDPAKDVTLKAQGFPTSWTSRTTSSWNNTENAASDRTVRLLGLRRDVATRAMWP
jgi:hypothetical protein